MESFILGPRGLSNRTRLSRLWERLCGRAVRRVTGCRTSWPCAPHPGVGSLLRNVVRLGDDPIEATTMLQRFRVHKPKRAIGDHIGAQRHPRGKVFGNFQMEGKTVRFVQTEVERAVRQTQ